jgi:uncharacterized protein (TIGR00730 family)
MPVVRFSGKISGENDPHRSIRAKLLYQLYGGGWDIYNANGDQTIRLGNIEKKIIEADAFVFTPGATLEDMFKAVSIFVGYQTIDANLAGKPTVVLNHDGSWDPIFSLLKHLEELGTIQQNSRDYLLECHEADEVTTLLEQAKSVGLPDAGRHKSGDIAGESFDHAEADSKRTDVCVFCSASIKDEAYLRDGWEMGALLAKEGMGCVSGAGRTGIMGAVVAGAVENGGWAGGSNVPHIIELEGLPAGLSSFWLRPDIYTRMEVMIERSQAFVIFPGGAGTVQEMLALMIFQQQQHPDMHGKPVVVFDRVDEQGRSFWKPLIALLQNFCPDSSFGVVTKLEDVIPSIKRKLSESV